MMPLVPATFAICTLSTRHAALVAGADYTSRPNLTRHADPKLRLASYPLWTVPSSPVGGDFNRGASDGIQEIRKSCLRGSALQQRVSHRVADRVRHPGRYHAGLGAGGLEHVERPRPRSGGRGA